MDWLPNDFPLSSRHPAVYPSDSLPRDLDSREGELIMSEQEIVDRCVSKLGMSRPVAEWVAANLYDYIVPDWSEWSWRQIDEALRDVQSFYKEPST